ncbi:hypothetical protein NEMIN01_2220 [Nematocida minor]|uniref:uncharacterized protein n=1 Tax=Nematocida minor TaxID=1912983 RepID=UPI00221F7675|nr:uncharacterized protein NEMIN01_2220 [Nematocida minor]KAI5192797.1 hypothetical protein NEMIN01_2220 [Nematocida minor]
MDSTILNRIGRKLEPDDKIRNSSKILDDLMSSEEFKKRFKEQSQKKLQIPKKGNIYYKKYRKPNLDGAKKPLEESLQLKPQKAEHSSLIKEKISALEFQFKRMHIMNSGGKQTHYAKEHAEDRTAPKDKKEE